MGFETILGALSFERIKPQPVRLSFSIWMDFEKVAETDNLKDTVNYAALAEDLKTFIIQSKFQLIETLVLRCAEKILAYSEKILACEVTIKKPEAIAGAKNSAAEIRLDR
ncbi:MAG: dihydroneopterin aldolase [Fibrobacteraceae bacterium]|nr:dihydroneopterin aldolase [Fibrobacteraceae bacterium]